MSDNYIKGTLDRMKIFLWLFVFFATAGAVYYFVAGEKGALVLQMQEFYTPTLNKIVRVVTDFGTYPLILLTLVTVGLLRKKTFVPAVIALAVEGVVVDILKKVVYRAPRPSVYLEDAGLTFAEGLRVLCCNSFPSGHSSLAFACATVILLSYSRGAWIQIGLFLLAASVALSRVYLAVHFLEDILVGSALGILVPILIFWLYEYVVRRRRIPYTPIQKS